MGVRGRMYQCQRVAWDYSGLAGVGPLTLLGYAKHKHGWDRALADN